MSKALKKIVDETREHGYTELDLCDRGISSLTDIPNLGKLAEKIWRFSWMYFTLIELTGCYFFLILNDLNLMFYAFFLI